MTEEEYILTHGGDDIIGQTIIMQSSHSPHGLHCKDCEALNKHMGMIVERNYTLRQEFRQKVADGLIHKDTIIETLLMAANGHEDNEATHAARRALKKRGISYDCI